MGERHLEEKLFSYACGQLRVVLLSTIRSESWHQCSCVQCWRGVLIRSRWTLSSRLKSSHVWLDTAECAQRHLHRSYCSTQRTLPIDRQSCTLHAVSRLPLVLLCDSHHIRLSLGAKSGIEALVYTSCSRGCYRSSKHLVRAHSHSFTTPSCCCSSQRAACLSCLLPADSREDLLPHQSGRSSLHRNHNNKQSAQHYFHLQHHSLANKQASAASRGATPPSSHVPQCVRHAPHFRQLPARCIGGTTVAPRGRRLKTSYPIRDSLLGDPCYCLC